MDFNGSKGFTLVELVLATALLSVILITAFTVALQGQDIAVQTESRSNVYTNVRLAMDRLERELRMVGFGVPAGAEIGGNTLWTPAIFHASSTEIGFRGDTDGGRASITCTPRTGNANCPRDEILLESIAYYDALNCKRPDDDGIPLPVVLVLDRNAWEPATCTGVNDESGSIDVSANVSNSTFRAGVSDVLTIEQVYYRYVADLARPYGRLERSVRYANTPDDVFPVVGATWAVVADHLTDFALEYRDAAGNVLAGNPLSADDRALVSTVFMYVEGFDSVGPQEITQILQAESQVLVRNAGL